MKYAIVILLLMLSLAVNAVLWFRLNSVEKQTAGDHEDYELGEKMGYMQRYADKLWFAGEAGNWNLANFYEDEIDETAEGIGRAGVVDEGVDVSTLLINMLHPVIDSVGKAVAARDPVLFRTSYQEMIETCNACHRTAKHPFIRIVIPAGPPTRWNQSFATP